MFPWFQATLGRAQLSTGCTQLSNLGNDEIPEPISDMWYLEYIQGVAPEPFVISRANGYINYKAFFNGLVSR